MPRIGAVTVTWIVEAAFGYDPDDPAPVWTNITAYVRGFSTRRGRKREIDRVTAGTCTIRLKNFDRRFEGGYTGGAYGSNVVPMVPIRIRVTRGATTYPVFYGFADEWVPSLDARSPNVAYVDLRATDAFKVLALIPLVDSPWAQEVLSDSPLIWWRFGEQKFSTVAVDRSGNGRHGLYDGNTKSTSGLVPHDVDDAREFDGASGSVSRNGSDTQATGTMSVEAWVDYKDDGTSFANTIAAQYGPSDSWELDVQTTVAGVPEQVTYRFLHQVGTGAGPLAFISSYPAGLHHVVATYDSGTANLYINGTLVASDSTTVYDPENVSPSLVVGEKSRHDSSSRYFSGSIDELAVYDTALNATQIADHYAAATTPRSDDVTGARLGWILDQAGWPAGLRDIDTGQVVLDPVVIDGRSAIDMLWEVVEFEDGNLFVARDGDVTFLQRTARYSDTTATVSQASYTGTSSTSKASGVTFDYSDEQLINHAVVTTRAGHVFEREDATSIGRYLRRTRQMRVPSSEPNYADAYAQWVVQTGKDPKRRITSLKVPTQRDTTTFDQTLGLELGYRVTVALDPPGTGTINEALLVEGIDHDVTRETWTTTLWCSPDPSPDIVVVGVSLVGGSEVVGY